MDLQNKLRRSEGGGGSGSGGSGGGDQNLKPPAAQPCPRCNSTNTKFCYYNNYSMSQPRYFCKGCRRYWTHGGTLRNVPVGGGCRKSKRPKVGSSSSAPPQQPPPMLPTTVPGPTLADTTTTNNNNNAALIGSLNHTASTNNAPLSFAVAATSSVNEQPQFSLSTSGPSSFQAFQLNPGSDKKTMFGPQLESSVAGDSVRSNNNNNNNNNSNRVLMQFFDDWPRSDNADGNNISSTTSLSISTPGNPTSDFLRLSTGNGDELGRRDGNGNEGQESGQEMSWGSSNAGGWGANSMGGGPLAEALRSSTNSSSPTSVLHQLRRCSASDTSFVSA